METTLAEFKDHSSDEERFLSELDDLAKIREAVESEPDYDDYVSGSGHPKPWSCDTAHAWFTIPERYGQISLKRKRVPGSTALLGFSRPN